MELYADSYWQRHFLICIKGVSAVQPEVRSAAQPPAG